LNNIAAAYSAASSAGASANFRNMMTDKEWIPSGWGDRNVIAYGLDLFTYYKTENEQYQLLAHCLLAKHCVQETGKICTKMYRQSLLLQEELQICTFGYQYPQLMPHPPFSSLGCHSTEAIG